MYSTRIDIPAGDREKLVALLNARLADLADLQTQAKQAHWNVKGPAFVALHELFDSIADSVEDCVDLVAERVTVLGGVARGTARMAAASSTLGEYPANAAEGTAHVDALATAVATAGKHVRAAIGEAGAIGDAGTEDLFTEVSRGLDKHLWLLEAHLQAEK
ncbi:MAG: DNA starvation/stationary phase protection protein Dps [Myxococcota bacterium]